MSRNKNFYSLPKFRLPEVFFSTNEPNVCVVPFVDEMISSVKSSINRKSEIKRPLNFSKIKTTKKVAPLLKKYIQKVDNDGNPRTNIVIGGSAAACTQVRNSRLPNDIDLEAANQHKAKRDVVAILKTKYKNVTTRSMKREDGRTYIQVLVNGNPVVDIKPLDKTGHRIKITDKYYAKEHSPIMIDNILYERSTDLLAKKAKAVNEDYYIPIYNNQLVKERTCKDSQDFYSLRNSLFGSNFVIPDIRIPNINLFSMKTQHKKHKKY